MIFDRTCGVVDRHREYARHTKDMDLCLRECELFIFSKEDELNAITEFAGWTNEAVQEALDNFFLPFPVTAIECPDRLVLFCDPLDSTGRNYVGAGKLRPYLIACHPKSWLDDGSLNDFKDKKMGDELTRLAAANPNMICAMSGQFNLEKVGTDKQNKRTWDGSLSEELFLIADKVKVWFLNKPEKRDSELQTAVINSLKLLIWMNQPSRFILEMTPRKTRPMNSPKIPRSCDRKTYTSLHPAEIRKRYGLGAEKGTHASPAPHPRRAHTRLLSAERYGENKGKRINVASSWVGPVETMQHGKRYKVLVNK